MAPRAKKAAAVAVALAEEAVERRPIALRGSLDRADPDGRVEGWCWSPDEPDHRREVAVLVDGEEVARICADGSRPDLLAAGVGDGGHSFSVLLDPARLTPDATAQIVLRDVASGVAVGVAAEVRWRDAAPVVVAARAPEPLAIAGSLDRVSRDGWVSGWCWYPERPEHRVELTVLVDDVPVGTVIADGFRQDLQQAGIGDGAHGFQFALPYAALAERGTLTVSVQDRATGRTLGDPITMRIGRMAAAEERIEELERQLRLLRGQLDEMHRAAAERREDRAARELFATVAGFFHELAEGGTRRTGEMRLAGTLADITARFPVLALAQPAAPCATLCLAATAPVECVYRCLAALHAAGVDGAAEVVLLDDGAADSANALLPTVIRNLRYRFLPGPEGYAEARNALAREAATELLVWLVPQARLAGDWLTEIAATFAREPEAVAVGGRLLREDGLLESSGLLLGPDGRLRDPGHLAPGERPEWRALRPVDALAGGAWAVRRDAFLGAGGFSAMFRRFGHATVDLCARLRAAGGAVLLQPTATALWIDGPGSGEPAGVPDFAIAEEETLRLRERVLAGGWPAPSAAPVGRALVLDDDLPQPDRDAGSIATFEQMLLLRRLGWQVTFAPLHNAAPSAAAMDELARHGITVAAAPAWPSVTAYLEAEGPRLDLLHIYRYANAEMLAERARALAPNARIVLATADLHHLREQRRARLAGLPPPEAARVAELAAIRAADATILTNDHEHALLAAEPEVAGARLVLLRWITRPVPPRTGFEERQGICFVGNFRHPPNLDGIGWFIAEVMPALRRDLPGARLMLAGADMPPALRELEGEAVELLGWVPDLAELFGRVRVSVAPLRYGAGFKGKVATSLAHGLPVVGSSISMEGTGLAEGDGIAVADTAEAFVAAIRRLHEDATHWRAQSARALERVTALYSPAAARDVWCRLLGGLGLPAGA